MLDTTMNQPAKAVSAGTDLGHFAVDRWANGVYIAEIRSDGGRC